MSLFFIVVICPFFTFGSLYLHVLWLCDIYQYLSVAAVAKQSETCEMEETGSTAVWTGGQRRGVSAQRPRPGTAGEVKNS